MGDHDGDQDHADGGVDVLRPCMPLTSATENGNSITMPETESAMPPSATDQKITFWPALNRGPADARCLGSRRPP